MRVTIGIPVYNCEQWIATAIQSALDQTWPDKEVIVVDDGSTDCTPAICARFQEAVRLVRLAKSGGNAARNEVLRLATGSWIQYLDADDYLAPNKIASQVNDCGNLACFDVLCSATIKEYWENGVYVRRETMPLSRNADLRAVYLDWQMPQTGACLWRRDALARIGGWSEERRRLQDSELHVRAFKAGLRYGIAGEPAAIWRMWSQATVSNQDKTSMLLGITELVRELVAWLEAEGKLTDHHRRLAGKLCFQMARDLAGIDLRMAKQYYLERKKEGLVRLEGPRSPWKYRLMLRFFGFEKAEQLASLMRGRTGQPSW
ncbi:MAG TPA: glycosyltransferase family 2 protein [Chthoniobacterales bacterium]